LSAIGDDPSVRGLPERIHARTRGNPFFAEEIVQALIEDGSLAGAPAAYRLTHAIEKVPLPETVHNVLAARIDRLAPREKQVLQTAAVIGRELPLTLLATVCDVGGRELDEALAALRRGEFLLETALYPQVEFAFKHPLTHEVAYQSQLAARRAAVHRAVAQAMETLYPEQLDERAAEIAWHWEGAGEPAAAAHWHARAADWVERRDMREAMRHWRVVYGLLPELPEDRAEAGLLIHLCERLLIFGGWSLGQTEADSRALLEHGMRVAEHHRDHGALVRLHLGYANARFARGHLSEHLALAREGVSRADGSGDENLRALARAQVAIAAAFVGNFDECQRAIDDFFGCAGSGNDLIGYFGTSPQALAHVFRGVVLQNRGCMEEAAGSFERARETAATAGPITQVLADLVTLIFATARGELSDAIGLAARNTKVAEEFGAPNLRAAGREGQSRRATSSCGRVTRPLPLRPQPSRRRNAIRVPTPRSISPRRSCNRSPPSKASASKLLSSSPT
jgi:hypothetical protein